MGSGRLSWQTPRCRGYHKEVVSPARRPRLFGKIAVAFVRAVGRRGFPELERFAEWLSPESGRRAKRRRRERKMAGQCRNPLAIPKVRPVVTSRPSKALDSGWPRLKRAPMTRHGNLGILSFDRALEFQ